MGICCVKNYKEENGELIDGGRKGDFITLFKNNKDVIWKVVRIQAALRRYRAMKEFKALKESSKPHRLEEITAAPVEEPANNQRVQEIEEKFGLYKCDEIPDGLGQREKRPPLRMENNATYTGEWYYLNLSSIINRNIETNRREGYGVQVWSDGSK